MAEKTNDDWMKKILICWTLFIFIVSATEGMEINC